MNKRRIVVTAALPYANGNIHLGHLLEYLQTDYWVRFQKMRGNECVYICADDTHGTPIMIRARKENRTPENLIEEMWKLHFEDFSAFQVGFDNFYSTNSPENLAFCTDIFAKLQQHGALITRTVEQLYCPNCKMFLPDRFVKGTCPKCGATEQYGDSCEKCGSTYGFDELKEAHCATCGCTDLEIRGAEHILFNLAKFKPYLKEWLEGHTPGDVARKLQEWFGEDKELLPWDISRDAPYFGFEIPGHPGKFFYVWLDAPVGYMASLKNWCDKHGEKFEEWWQNPEAELYHFIGKDIVRFHCLFWPALLHASGYKGPTHVNVHGFLTVNGEKMSKSRGTFLNARVYLNHLDPSYLRYYYACKVNNTTDDIDLNLDDFVQRVNADLVGKITNLASRGAQMIGKRLDGRLGEPDEEGAALIRDALSRAEMIAGHYESRRFSQVPVEVCKIADAANAYFDAHAPWKTIESDPEGTRKVLTTILNLYRILAIYLRPILPVYADNAAALFGEEPWTWASLDAQLVNRPIGEYRYLATRIDPKAVQAMIDEQKALFAASAPAPAPAPAAAASADVPPLKETIDFSRFDACDLRVARVESCTAVPKSKKLVRFELDVGALGHRTVFSGIRAYYPDPSVLDGKLVVFVANLAPREMKNVGTSEGMVLSAGMAETGISVLTVLGSANPGDPAC